MATDIDVLQIQINAQATKANDAVDRLVTKLDRLTTSLSSIDGSKLNGLANGVQHLGTAMQSMNNVKTADFTRLAKNLTALNNIDTSKLSGVSANITAIGKSLSGLKNVSNGANQIAELANGLKQLGYKSSSQAIKNIPQLATAIKQLMTELSQAPKVNRNLIDMTNALAKLARTGASSGKAATSLSKSLNTYSASAQNAKTHSFSLASAIGKIYASYWLIFRAFSGIRKAIDISSDLTEVQNVVDVTFGDMASKVEYFSKTSIEQLGMSELTLKEVASRFQAMGTAMDINPSLIKNATKYINKQTNGYVELSDSMSDVSLSLTKLTADMASFYNVEQKDVAEDLESIFTGQTRPLRTYGLDLTEATLKEWALKNGLDANIDAMTQAEKTMLRYQYVLSNTGAAHGDFARTADTWANQVRILKENFRDLGKTLGGSFIGFLKPVVKALNVVIGKLKEFAVAVSNSLGKIFGWKYEDAGGGIASDFEDAEDASSGISDNLGSAAANAKKLKSHLLPIDELNVVEPNSESGHGGSGGSGGSSGFASGASNGGNWVQNGGIFKDYESDLDTLYKLGDYIGTTLTNTMNNINWHKVYEGARHFGSGLAEFLNGLISPELFGAVGRTIASSLNTILYSALSFGETFDFRDFGVSISTGINEFFNTYDFAMLANTLNTWVGGLTETLFAAVSKVEWGGIYDAVVEFLENLDIETVSVILGAITIKKIAEIKLASTALSIVGGSLSKQIASSIASHLGIEIAANAGITTALSTGITTALAGSGTAFAAGVKALFGSKVAESALAFVEPISKAFAGIGSVIAGVALAVSSFFSMWSKGFNWIKEALMVIGIALAAVGAVILGVAAAPAAIVASIVAAAATAAIVIHDNWDAIKEWASGIPEFFGEKFDSAKDKIKEVFSPIVTWFHEKWENVKNVFKDVKKFFKDAFQKAFDSVKEIWSGIGRFFGGVANSIIDPIQKAINGIIKGINWVLEKFGSETRIKEWTAYPKFSKGANGLPEDTIGMVNDQKGSTYKELIVPPHGEPFIPEGRNVLLPLEKGTKIMPAGQTEKLMNMVNIPKFESGIGKFFFGAWESIKNFTGNVFDYISNPDKLVQLAIDKFIDTSGWNGVAGDMAKGAVSKTLDSAVGFVKKLFDSNTTVNYKPGAGVEQWRNLATRALQITNQYSDSNLAALLMQMQHESGGNPNAINNWDINAKNGIPSKGLMQVIDPTFRSYALAPYNKNIYDPLSNMIASIRYTISRYGSLYKGWTARGYKGYRNGIGEVRFTDLIPRYSVGGFPEDGLFYANHNELVGKFSNGKTAVANNEDIQTGFKQGVKEAVAETLAPYLREIAQNTRETADKDFTTKIDTRTLVNEYNSRSKRNGFSFT